MLIPLQCRGLIWLTCLLLASTLVLGCRQMAPSDHDRRTLANLMQLIDQRLAVAPLVARAKWNSGAPIDDPAREKLLLESLAGQARDDGLDPAFVRRFFQSQFDAGKIIQAKLHAQWHIDQQAKFADAPDLARDVRPELDRLTPLLMKALRDAYPTLSKPGARSDLVEQGRQWIRGDFDGAPRATALAVLIDATAD
jgi:chorismate mutase